MRCGNAPSRLTFPVHTQDASNSTNPRAPRHHARRRRLLAGGRAASEASTPSALHVSAQPRAQLLVPVPLGKPMGLARRKDTKCRNTVCIISPHSCLATLTLLSCSLSPQTCHGLGELASAPSLQSAPMAALGAEGLRQPVQRWRRQERVRQLRPGAGSVLPGCPDTPNLGRPCGKMRQPQHRAVPSGTGLHPPAASSHSCEGPRPSWRPLLTDTSP